MSRRRPPADPPPADFPTYDGVFLKRGASIKGPDGSTQDCKINNVGRILAGTTEEGTGTYVIPEVGKYYARAASFFQNGIIGVVGTIPLHYPGAYDIRKHSVVYGIGADSVAFTGTLTLNPYVWDFGDGSELSLTWPEGPGVAVPVNPANYGSYGGEAKHTYDYHGRFGVNVNVGRNLSGDFEYDYREVHTYEEVWPAATVLGNFPNGVWNRSCPSAARYRLVPICLTLEWNDTYNYRADPVAWIGAQPPPPAVQMTAADCASISASDYSDSDGTSSTTEDSPSADCAYGSWQWVSSVHNVRRAWSSYDECQDSNGNITGLARIHVVDGCSQSTTWFAPVSPEMFPIDNLQRESAGVELRHDPSYGAPEYSYPVRRARPILVPNP